MMRTYFAILLAGYNRHIYNILVEILPVCSCYNTAEPKLMRGAVRSTFGDVGKVIKPMKRKAIYMALNCGYCNITLYLIQKNNRKFKYVL